MIFAFAGAPPQPRRGVGETSTANVVMNSDYTLVALALVTAGALYWWNDGEKAAKLKFKRNQVDVDWAGVGAGAAVGVVSGLLVAYFANPERALPQWRKDFLSLARDYAARQVPYQWGGGRSAGDYGVDCSGLLIRAQEFASAQGSSPPPLPAEGRTSTVWHEALPKIDIPRPGDMALYGTPDHASHVVMVEKWDPATQTASIIGANGGDKDVNSPEIAASRGAFVRSAPTHLYRNGFLGFASFEQASQSVTRSRHVVLGAPPCCG